MNGSHNAKQQSKSRLVLEIGTRRD